MDKYFRTELYQLFKEFQVTISLDPLCIIYKENGEDHIINIDKQIGMLSEFIED